MSNSSIWVLVAGENNATICTSRDGSSQLLREVTPNAARCGAANTDKAKRTFAWELMAELSRGARDGAFDGIIIVAAQDMLDELRRVAMPAIRKYLIAEIVGTPDWAERTGAASYAMAA